MLLNEKEEQFDDPLTVQINKYADRCINNSCIDPNLYDKFDVKRGLRDRNTGKGVLTGGVRAPFFLIERQDELLGLRKKPLLMMPPEWKRMAEGID